MSLRIRTARWFELLLPRLQLPQALDLLARAGAVELEAQPDPDWAPVEINALRSLMVDAEQLRRRYLAFLPLPRVPSESAPGLAPGLAAEARLTVAVAQLKAWEQAAAAEIADVERLQGECGELRCIADFLCAIAAEPEAARELDFGALARPLNRLVAALFVLPADVAIPQDANPILVQRVHAADHLYALVLGAEADIVVLARKLGGREARPLSIPAWLDGRADQALAQIRNHIGLVEHQIGEHRRRIDALSDEHHISEALSEIERLQWLTDHLGTLATSEHLGRITGWTVSQTPQELTAPLQRAGLSAVADFPKPPSGYRPPTISDNPRWARPFELFLQLAGTPNRDEADPSMLVAFIAPLMFGYMFGDLGQGLLLFIAGLLLRRRWPMFGMLVPGGLLAMGFGLLFGSVFTSTHWIPALWTDPIRDPLPVLGVPLAGGALLILLGMVLNAMTAAWGGQLANWLREEAGLVPLYLAGFVALLDGGLAIAIAAFGALWFVLAPALGSASAWRRLPARAGELLERMLQLAVNTLSFIRVGAFALAHAGLSLAVAALAEAAGGLPGRLAVLVAGNLLILALEGMVVGIQTTRLLLFEFFIRFVRGDGRPFRPLLPAGH
jgi:V/A-type H+-transporting ATPase subunit I